MRLGPEATKGWSGEQEKEEYEPCYPVHFGVIRSPKDEWISDDEPTYMVRCAACDEPVPFYFYDDEEEWQEFRTSIGATKRRYDPDTDEFIYADD